jgi:hypothetical protein
MAEAESISEMLCLLKYQTISEGRCLTDVLD